MWQVELNQIDSVVDGITKRKGRGADMVLDTIVYALMSLRQPEPVPIYYVLLRNGVHQFAVVTGRLDTGELFLRVHLLNAYRGKLVLHVPSSESLESVVRGDWHKHRVHRFLRRFLLADENMLGAYDEISSINGRVIFQRLLDDNTRVVFERYAHYKNARPLPPPVRRVRTSLRNRKWKRSPTNRASGLPRHITLARSAPDPYLTVHRPVSQSSPSRNAPEPPDDLPPSYSDVTHHKRPRR